LGNRRRGRRRKPKAAKASSQQAADVDLRPKAVGDLTKDDGGHSKPVFSFATLDDGYVGEWGWHLLDGNEAELVLQLKTFGSQTWLEIMAARSGGHKMHHWQDVSSLPSEARKRLAERQWDTDQLFRFRHGGKCRLWGYRDPRGIFHVIWWDPNHRVYPTEPD